MKYSILLTLFICSYTIVQICAWKTVYPINSEKLGFSRRPQRSVFGTPLIDRQLQAFLTPLQSMRTPQVKQRTIRDLMTQLIANNQRVPMMSAPSFNRQIVQRDVVRPTLNQNLRGTNSQRYRQALALSGSSVMHSLENPRAQSVVIRDPTLKKMRPPSSLRPRPMFHQSPVRAPASQKQTNIPQVVNEFHGIPSNIQSTRQQHNAASLDSTIADILSSSSSSNNKQGSQKVPKRVEVVHHIPMSSNPSNLRTAGPAVVYISKPKNSMQVPKTTFMRDVPQSPLLPSSQTKLTQNRPFIMGEQDAVLSQVNNLNQEMRFRNNRPRNPQFATSNSKPLRQNIQGPHLRPSMQGNLQDHRNSEFNRAVQKIPQQQFFRGAPPSGNTKQGILPPVSAPARDKVPRINRLRQELNAELEQLRKLVPPSPVMATKRPQTIMPPQIPHPFLIPSPQLSGSPVINKQMKPTLTPEIVKNIPKGRIIATPKPKPIRMPHFSSHKVVKEQFSKLQPLQHSPFNHKHPPVLSESSVDSEELSEILKNMGYHGDSKLIHTAAGMKPVKLIIPNDENREKLQAVIPSSSKGESLSPPQLRPPSSEDSVPSHAEDSPSRDKFLDPSQSEYLPQSDNEELSASHDEHLHSSQNENLTPSPYEDLPSSENGYLHSPNHEDSQPSETEGSPPSQDEHLSHHHSEDLLPHKGEDRLPPETENLSPPDNDDLLPLSNTEESSTVKTDGVSPTESGDSSTPRTDTLNSDSVDKTDSNSNKPLYAKYTEKKEFSTNTENLPSNKSSPTRTYWDFRKLNNGLQTSTEQTIETVPPIAGVVRKEPAFIPGVSNYQGEESIASISFKEEFPAEEEIKEKYANKHSHFKPNSGTLHDIYNMKIYEEEKGGTPIKHVVRNFPQHLVPTEPEVIPTPSSENKLMSSLATTAAYEHEGVGKNPELPTPKRVPNFIKPPRERTRNIFPALNIRERPLQFRTTLAPRYLPTNRNININPYQRTTPRYIITKSPHRQSFGQRNRPRNENSLVRKYVPPGRQQQFNRATPSFNRVTPAFNRAPGPLDHAVNPSHYITPETFIPNPTRPQFMNFRFKPYTTEPTFQTQPGWKYDEPRTVKPESGKDNYFNDYKPDIFTTTQTPEVVTRNNFEPVTAESQLENTQKAENTANEFEFQEGPETVTIPNKQFFRGPQHSIAYDDMTTNSFEESTTDFVPNDSMETTPSLTTMTEGSNVDSFMPYNETGGVRKYSVHSQTKVINALHLANKVFGRRNHTSPKQTLTTQMPHAKHKFTYSAVSKSPSDVPVNESESTAEGKRLVFNFRTGTTQSLPQRTSSAVPKVIYTPTSRGKFKVKATNQSSDFISVLKEDGEVISSPKNSSKTSLFQHIIFSQPNISSKPLHNQSVATDLYGILKPITKPYNESMTTFEENDFKKTTTKALRGRLGSTITPFFAGAEVTDQMTHSPSTTYFEESPTEGTEYQRLLPTVSDSENDDLKETTSEGMNESTEPFTKGLTEIQTETTTGYEGRTSKVDPATNATVSPSTKEAVTEPINQEQLIVDSLKSMKLKMQDMASKGLRHLMPLVMDLSSDVSISSDCTFSLLRWLRAVRTMEQWAVRMMDASSKMPEGILYGTFSTFGSYDECIGIKTPKANLQMPYSGQYCSINIQPILPPRERHFTIQNAFRKYPKLKKVFQEMNIEEDTMAYYYILKHRIGLCMPSTCSMEDLGNVTEKLADQLKMKISVERCETSEKPSLTRGQVISMSSVLVAFGIVILATIVDISIRIRSDHEMDIDEIIRKKNGLRQFSFVFSAYGNARKILNTSIPTTHLSSLHGIKFLSISWVMLGHVYYCKDYLTLAGLNKVRDLGSNLAFQVVLNSAFAADTFFFLSGLLVVYSTFLYLENNNGHFTIVGFYIRRYWRLTPAFLMISGVILLGPLAGSGPIWHETLHPFVSGCENYWWTNLFYFSNFVPTAKTCVPHGWFLSCDMQFYIVAPIIILALYRRPKLGVLLIILGILSSMITTGFLTFLYNLPPVSLFSLPDPKDINEYLDTVGYKPYAHYASYCVGMATGFLLAAKQKISLSKCLQIFGWIISSIVCCLVIYGTWNWNSGELPSWPVSVAYATTSRTVWCLGVAWVTVVCYAGHGGPVNSILSWHGFIPLSRLSYLAYLIHPLLMYLYASYVRSPFYFSQYVVVYLYLGHLFVTFGLAFLFSLAFEVPFLNLEKIITKYLDKSKRKRRASFSNHHNNWQHPEHPELKDSVVLMRRRADKFLT